MVQSTQSHHLSISVGKQQRNLSVCNNVESEITSVKTSTASWEASTTTTKEALENDIRIKIYKQSITLDLKITLNFFYEAE